MNEINMDMYQKLSDDTAPIAVLEKQYGATTLDDISEALEEFERLYKAGIASEAEILCLSRAYPDNEIYKSAAADIEVAPIVVGGPASVEVIDREGHLITTAALEKAFTGFMKNFRTRNTMVLHSDVQVGWALPAYISESGEVFKSGVDPEQGLFFITELRGDTSIAKRVLDQIEEGTLKSYSIAGSAVKTQRLMKNNSPYMQVDELELSEITVCEKGVNQEAKFDLLKTEGMDSSITCTDGSCLVATEHTHRVSTQKQGFYESPRIYKTDNTIDYRKSLEAWIKFNN